MNTKPLISIVEDSLTQAKQIAATATCCGVRAIIAGNGLDALNMVDQERPVLIVFDVNLPRMDGYPVCQRLKRNPTTAHIPVIMLTSADSADTAIYGLDVGADDYIAKDSFTVDHLSVPVSAYLGTKEEPCSAYLCEVQQILLRSAKCCISPDRDPRRPSRRVPPRP